MPAPQASSLDSYDIRSQEVLKSCRDTHSLVLRFKLFLALVATYWCFFTVRYYKVKLQYLISELLVAA